MNKRQVKTNLFNALKSNWTLILILFIFAFWTKYLTIKGYGYAVLEKEYGLFDLTCSLFIIYLIYLNVKFRNILSGLSAKILVNFKIFMLILLLWEENSNFTQGRMDVLTKFNAQNELTLHNLNFFSESLIRDLTIPMTNISFSISYNQFLVLTLFLFLGIGSYIPLLKKFRILFLERQYSLFWLICPMNIILSKLNGPSEYFIHGELFELFFYGLFILDTLLKVKIIKDQIIPNL